MLEATLAAIALLIIAGLTAVVSVIYRMAFYTDRRRHPAPDAIPGGDQYARYAPKLAENVRKLMAQRYEPVEIRSFDGLKLAGRYYDAGEGAPVSIIFHGFRSSSMRDASGGAPFCMGRGFSVLAVDQCAHGESEGRTITYGIKERVDCLSWIDYVIGRCGPDVRILLMGVSMGAATVMMASESGFPPNVKGIAADCGYTSPKAIIRKVIRDWGLPDRLIIPFVKLTARIAGFSLSESSAISAAKTFNVPTAIIHGDADRLVPVEMGRAIAGANPEMCTFTVINGAGHGMGYYVDEEKYLRAAGEICDIVCGKENI